MIAARVGCEGSGVSHVGTGTRAISSRTLPQGGVYTHCESCPRLCVNGVYTGPSERADLCTQHIEVMI